MIETANPSLVDVLDLHLPLVASGVGEAQLEIVRRLEQLLPGVIDLDNQRHEWQGVEATPRPRRFTLARNTLTEQDVNCILVGASVETSAQGIGAFKNAVQVTVYSIEERLSSPRQQVGQWRRAELIRACLRPFLNGCVDANGTLVWRQLVPTGYGSLPGDWGRQFSGMACQFMLVQAPG